MLNNLKIDEFRYLNETGTSYVYVCASRDINVTTDFICSSIGIGQSDACIHIKSREVNISQEYENTVWRLGYIELNPVCKVSVEVVYKCYTNHESPICERVKCILHVIFAVFAYAMSCPT